jgi:hypothetical protein
MLALEIQGRYPILRKIDDGAAMYDLKTGLQIGTVTRISAAVVRISFDSIGIIDLYSHINAVQSKPSEYTSHSILTAGGRFLNNDYAAFEALYSPNERVFMLQSKK